MLPGHWRISWACIRFSVSRPGTVSGVNHAAMRASCVRPRLDSMDELITALKEKELLSILTEKQRELYLAMTREGLTLREFARRKGIGIRAAFDLKAAVQKKFQKTF